MRTKLFKILVVLFIMFSEGVSQTVIMDTVITLNPKATYLKLNNDTGALYAVAVNLDSMGLIYPDYVILQRIGDYDNGPYGDTYIGMIAVFSANDSLLAPELLNRVPGAIDAGEEFITYNTYRGDLPTDIPEDFFVDSLVIQIPDSAAYVFVSPNDAMFFDNGDPDGDFGIRVAKTEIQNVREVGINKISSFELSQNYPNPFNPSTTIAFTLPKSEFAELKVYNVLGKEVSSLVSRKLNQGNHTYTFDGKNQASGVYYYQFIAGDYREVKKMILLR